MVLWREVLRGICTIVAIIALGGVAFGTVFSLLVEKPKWCEASNVGKARDIHWEPAGTGHKGVIITLPCNMERPLVSIVAYPDKIIEVATFIGSAPDGGSIYIIGADPADLPHPVLLRVRNADYLVDKPLFERHELLIFRYWW